MENWQGILLLLVAAWFLQGVGTYVQMKRYRTMLRELNGAHPNGWMGAGNARGTFGKGVIAILIVTPDMVVRSVRIMEGRSVFARFRPAPELEGLTLEAIAARDHGPKGAGRAKALAMASEQVRKARGRAPEAGDGTAAASLVPAVG